MNKKTKFLKIFLLVIIIVSCQPDKVQDNKIEIRATNVFEFTNTLKNKLQNTHDLSLPDWGPYTKKYIGISHIPEKGKDYRFDLSVFPGYYRGRINVPNVLWESGFHPWEASPDLKYFSYRHELEWKDKVYADISFSEIDNNARLVRSVCVNNTDLKQNLVLHYMASFNYDPVNTCEVNLPEDGIWNEGIDYNDMQFAVRRPQDNLTYDGWIKGEIREKGFVNGSALGKGFGKNTGDEVTYKIKLEKSIKDGILVLRYRGAKGTVASFYSEGLLNKTVRLKGTGEIDLIKVDLGIVSKGEHLLKFISNGGSAIEIDGFVITSNDNYEQIKFTERGNNFTPEILPGPDESSIILKYKDTDKYYGIAGDFKFTEYREFLNDELDILLRLHMHNHVERRFEGKGEGHFTNTYISPIVLEPNSSKIIDALVCSGSKEEVESYISIFRNEYNAQEIWKAANGLKVKINTTKAGEKYAFSQQLMAATTITGLVYPVYTQKSYIKHYSPGRWWNSLYTWDSGFVGLGLSEIDRTMATECLNTYTTEPGNQSAFIHHGTPVPVQIYLFQELWNQTQSRELLEYFYPRLKQYYDFLAGRYGSSTTRTLKSGLIKTWDYFYNSGGWDDYPPQQYVHEHNLTATVAPVANTAHCIRTAKILSMAAKSLNKENDILQYDKDIKELREALQKYSWDQEAGYYGFVVHNEKGEAVDILKNSNGVNLNMGMGGAYPLVAGICNESQKQVLLDKLKSDKHLWTQTGLSAVDISSPYYRHDGYWNGAVWFPHQWFFWKTMLDLGEGEFAFRIAKKGLNIWKNETDASYNCYEHFLTETGRGAGWHQFISLSSPVLSWFNAYYKPGTLTCGFDILIENKEFSGDNSSLKANININKYHDNGKICVIAVMNPDKEYSILWNDKEAKYKKALPGLYFIYIDDDLKKGKLVVRPNG